jgi:DHA1 family quinolone resistance protein-like MFS transporter
MTVRRIKRAYFFVLALNWLAVGLTLPIFVLFMQARGLSLAQVGLVMGTYAVTIALLELPTGGLADSYGRKNVALLSQAFSLLSNLVLIVAFALPWFFLGAFLLGVSRALNSGSLDAWYVDSLQADDQDVDLQAALAQANTITLLALGAGTLAGGALPSLFDWLPEAQTSLLSPFTATLIASLVLKAVLFLFIALTIVEPRKAMVHQLSLQAGMRTVPKLMGDAFSLTVGNRHLLLLFGATLVAGFTLSGVEAFWQPGFAGLLGDATSQSWLFGLVMAISFLAGIGGNVLATHLSRHTNHNYALVAGVAAALQVGALLAMAAAQAATIFSGGFWTYYLGIGTATSPHETLVNHEIPAQRRSAMLSMQSLATYAGSFLGSMILGMIAQTRGISWAWFAAASVAMVSLALYARLAVLKRRAASNYDQQASIPDSS